MKKDVKLLLKHLLLMINHGKQSSSTVVCDDICSNTFYPHRSRNVSSYWSIVCNVHGHGKRQLDRFSHGFAYQHPLWEKIFRQDGKYIKVVANSSLCCNCLLSQFSVVHHQHLG